MLALIVRAINYNVGMQVYTVVFITTLEGIATAAEALSSDGDVVQSGVVAISIASKAMHTDVVCPS